VYIDLNKSIYDLCKEDPRVIEVMISLGFTDIIKPAMLNTVGKMMTITKGARMKNIDILTIKNRFIELGYNRGFEMSEFIDNQTKKQAVLKGLIKKLHEGQTVDEVKAEFAKHFEHVSPTEISNLEAALIREGMPVEEIQSLCDVHAEVFKGSIEEIHAPNEEHQIPGHPVGTFIKEKRLMTD